MNLENRLKEERERLRLSQTAFADIAGASKHAQINWEKGEAAPNANALAAWSAVGVDVGYVVTGKRSSDWEVGVLASTAQAVNEIEPSGFGPLHDAFLGASLNVGERQVRLASDFAKLQLAIAACTEDQAVLVMESALLLATRLAASVHPPPPRKPRTRAKPGPVVG